MRDSCRRVWWAALSLSCLYAAAAVTAAGVQEDLAVVPEGALRRLAKRAVLPDYPEASRKRATAGRAVAQPEVDKEGRVTGAYVLEAPDDASGVVSQTPYTPATSERRAHRQVVVLTPPDAIVFTL